MAVPKLRFPEFTDDWEQRKLGDLYTERNERGNGSLQILSVSIHTGVSDGELDVDNLGKFVRRSEDKSTYKHVHSGDLIFNMMRAWQGAIGVAKTEGMISPAYISAIPSEDIYPPFMNYLLRRKDVINQINNLSYGVTDFRKRLYWNSFVQVNCKLPSVEEQRNITDVFEKIDHLITLHQRKLDDIKLLKKSMLQKMFPAEGRDVPEVRFPGFTAAWEQRKLGDECNQLTTFINPQNEPNRLFAEYSMPAYDLNKNPDYVLGSTMNSARKVVDRPCLLINKLNVRKQRIWCIEDPEKNAVCSAEFIPVCSEGIDLRFLSYVVSGNAFTSYLEDCSSGSSNSQKRVTPDTIMNAEICIPSRAEQQKIGAYFRDLDHFITLHQRKCDDLQKLKKALLQQMFC